MGGTPSSGGGDVVLGGRRRARLPRVGLGLGVHISNTVVGVGGDPGVRVGLAPVGPRVRVSETPSVTVLGVSTAVRAGGGVALVAVRVGIGLTVHVRVLAHGVGERGSVRARVGVPVLGGRRVVLGLVVLLRLVVPH